MIMSDVYNSFVETRWLEAQKRSVRNNVTRIIPFIYFICASDCWKDNYGDV